SAHLFLLVLAGEVEACTISSRIHLFSAQGDQIETAGDFLPDRLLVIKRGPRLIDISQLHAIAHAQSPFVGFLLSRDHSEERRLPGAVWPDYANQGARRHLEREVFE